MPDSVDLRPALGPVRWQGNRSTCLAFATSAAHEVGLNDAHGMVDTSEEYLYWASKQHDIPGPGTTFAAVRDGLSASGHPLEEAWPYDPNRDDQAASYSPPAAAHTSQPRWHPDFTPIDATEAGVRAELDAGRVVVLGMPTWPDLDIPDDGKLTVPGQQDLDGDYHAVAIVGYDVPAGDMLIRNSWGDSWGDSGCAWLPMEFLREHACEAWAIGAAAAPQPQSDQTISGRYG
jgi:C1A family cysteine protease